MIREQNYLEKFLNLYGKIMKHNKADRNNQH
jgi:hypothetical protein